jgi:hypothetical protein
MAHCSLSSIFSFCCFYKKKGCKKAKSFKATRSQFSYLIKGEGMTKFLIVFIVSSILTFTRAVNAEEWPGYSGMVKITDNTFLTINDRKNLIEPGPRLGVLTILEDHGIIFYPLSVDDWFDREKEPSDLEACCSIPNRPNEFLLAESGYYKNKFGRIFHVRLTKTEECIWRVEVIQAVRIYNRKLDDKGSTYKFNQVEGIACYQAFGKTFLIYGERGGQNTKLARIIWGELNLDKKDPFVLLGDKALVAKSLLGDRDCSDLFLKQGSDSHIVWSVATIDSDINTGPFKSVIYEAGSITLNTKKEIIDFEPNNDPNVIWQLDGLKVEALATPASSIPKSEVSIGSDDEDYGGIWRPLFK